MNIGPIHSHAPLKADPLPLEALAHNQTLSEEQKVAEASRQFEAVILRQILSQARKSVIHSKYNEESAASGIYQDMVTSQLADAISRNGGFGLAASLQKQLVHPSAASAAPGPALKPAPLPASPLPSPPKP